MKWMTRALGSALALSLASAAAAKDERLAPGDHALPLSHARIARSYVLHLPPAARGDASLPLVIAFHGGGGNAKGFQAYAGLDAVADREGFAVVYPNGTGRLAPRLLTWNAGRCCGFAMDEKIDDVGFARRVIEAVAEHAPIDRARVYATGHSNGAMMAYRLAAEAADEIAAIAPVAGAMNLRREFAPARSVPVLHIHSVDDPRALYAGGDNKSFAGTKIHHEPVVAGLQQWEKRNGCSGAGKELERRSTPAQNGDGEHTAIHIAASCPAGAAVEVWKLTGAGHGWPGIDPGPLPERMMGPHPNVISAAEEAWKFFARFRLAEARPATNE
ncbi:MAG TPA: PHB depolymerase family esterase [Myxococcota bacterium]|nr:PHB depolymerase family esterase [Myxococcota bacterium]